MHSHATAISDRRRGHTLLEVLVASTLMAITLVPALRLMRDSLSIGRELEALTMVLEMISKNPLHIQNFVLS